MLGIGGLRRTPRGYVAWARVAGVLAAAAQGCYFAAVARTSVTLATLITIGSMPMLVLAAERLIGRQRADRRTIAALILALVGLGLLVGWPSGGTLAGTALAVLAAAAFAALTTIGFGFAAGGLLLNSVAGNLDFDLTGTSAGLLLALAVAPTAVAYPLYFRGSRTVGAGTAAVLTLLDPLTAAVLAAALLGDRLGTVGVAGAVLLGMAMVLAARSGTP